MMSTSGGLKLRAVAGGPSVIKFTHNNWTGIKASGIPSAAVKKILIIGRRINIIKIVITLTKPLKKCFAKGFFFGRKPS